MRPKKGVIKKGSHKGTRLVLKNVKGVTFDIFSLLIIFIKSHFLVTI